LLLRFLGLAQALCFGSFVGVKYFWTLQKLSLNSMVRNSANVSTRKIFSAWPWEFRSPGRLYEHGEDKPLGTTWCSFTLFFETLIMTFVKNSMTPKTITRFVEKHDTRIWRLLEHYVEAGRAKYQAAKLNKPVSDFGTVI